MGSSFQTGEQKSVQNAQHRENRHLRKKYKKHWLRSFQHTKSTHTSESDFADRIEQVKETKLEKQLLKNVDSFPDGQRNQTSNLVSFEKTFVNKPFSESEDICINQLVMQMI